MDASKVLIHGIEKFVHEVCKKERRGAIENGGLSRGKGSLIMLYVLAR